MKPTLLLMGAYSDADMAQLDQDYDVLRYWEASDPSALIAKHADKIRAIATRGDLGAKKELIDRLPKLELVACFGVGTDAIDRSATRPRSIKITSTPDVLTDDVADLAIALSLGIARQIAKGDNYVRDGSWARENMDLVTRFHGKRMGIAGLGQIGKAIARRAEAFNMRVSYFGRNKQDDVAYTYHTKLTDLAEASDYLVAIVPGGAETHKLIGADVFAALGAQGYFINVARGSVVDEEALIAALDKKIIKGAALDVYLNEPNIDSRFAKLSNVLLHPHNGSGTVETRRAMGQLVRDNLSAFFAGRPLLTEVA